MLTGIDQTAPATTGTRPSQLIGMQIKTEVEFVLK